MSKQTHYTRWESMALEEYNNDATKIEGKINLEICSLSLYIQTMI